MGRTARDRDDFHVVPLDHGRGGTRCVFSGQRSAGFIPQDRAKFRSVRTRRTLWDFLAPCGLKSAPRALNTYLAQAGMARAVGAPAADRWNLWVIERTGHRTPHLCGQLQSEASPPLGLASPIFQPASRSAAVPGRSNVRGSKGSRNSTDLRRSTVSAPEDGRTPLGCLAALVLLAALLTFTALPAPAVTEARVRQSRCAVFNSSDQLSLEPQTVAE